MSNLFIVDEERTFSFADVNNDAAIEAIKSSLSQLSRRKQPKINGNACKKSLAVSNAID